VTMRAMGAMCGDTTRALFVERRPEIASTRGLRHRAHHLGLLQAVGAPEVVIERLLLSLCGQELRLRHSKRAEHRFVDGEGEVPRGLICTTDKDKNIRICIQRDMEILWITCL
jgi:hypothetical protein